MRAAVSLIALIAATPALGDDFFAQAPVAAATIYPDGATLTLRATLDLPAGTHDVFIAYPNADQLSALPRISTSENVTIGALGFRSDVVGDPRMLYTAAQSEAADAIDAAENAVEAKEDEIALAQTDIAALLARKDYLAAILPPENGTADEILAVADLIATQTRAVAAALEEARQGLRPLNDDLSELQSTLAAAQADLDRLSPPQTENDMLTIEVTVPTAGPITLELTEQTWNAGWRVDYDMDLNRDAGEIALDRKLVVMQNTDRAWTDVALTLSTARPNERIYPSEVYPDQANLWEPQIARSIAPSPAAEADMGMRMEEPVIAEGAPMKTAGLVVDGLAVSYVYPDPVSIAPGEGAELALDTLTVAADPTIEAAPRYDETAFLMAQFTNTTGEPILPGTASVSRDGNFVGMTNLALIPAGAEEKLAFGPIESLRLETIFKRNAEGDAGLITRSSTRVQEITFTVENLSDAPQELRAFFPLTYSEQEDLEVTTTATPAPNETDVDDRRGVSAWDMTVAPGEKKDVQITVDLDWPEGKQLNWNP